jgi:sugar lactone lactonase YvrE
MATHRLRAAVLLAACGLPLAACSSSSSGAHRTASGAPTGGGTAAATGGSPSATVAPLPAGSALSGCPAAPAAARSLPALYRHGQPDDLAVDGTTLWVSDVGAGTLTRVALAGTVLATLRGLHAPEGVVPRADGSLLVAEQSGNRVIRIGPNDARRSTFVQLSPPDAGAEGLDGIATDAAAARLLVPDSPHGFLLSAALESDPPLARLATGLGRPVGVVAIGDMIYVAAENPSPRGLLRIPAGGGNATPLGAFSQLDDVAAAGGILYATDLGAHALRAVDPSSGAQRVIATGLPQPQGLAVLPDGRLAVADSAIGAVLLVDACAAPRR